MSKYTIVITILMIIACLVSHAMSTEFQVLDFEEDPMDMRGTVRPYKDMNADPCAVLRVESDVPGDLNLTDVQVYHRDKESAGVYYFYISFRERHVTFASEGYLPLTYKIPQQMGKGKVYKVRIQSDRFGFVDENRPTIRLNYMPAGGEVVIGDIDNQVAPIDFSKGYMSFRPSSGEHTIRLNSGGRVWQKMFVLEAGQMVEENVVFPVSKSVAWDIEEPGKLYIDSQPQGATVFLNQADRGKTPVTIKDLQPGSYQVEVSLDLYLPQSKTIEVKSLDYTQETFQLVPNFGKLIIESDPPDAIVRINGRQIGKTRFEREQFEVGSYELKLSKPLYYDTTMTFEIKSDGEFIRTIEMQPQFGMVSIKSNPSGAMVTVDGENWGLTPILKRDEVLSGEHIVQFEKEYYFPDQTTIIVEDGKHLERDFELRSSVSWLSVNTFPEGAKVTLLESYERPSETPIKDWILDPGIYNLRIEKDLYEVYETAVSLALGERIELDPELIRLTGHLDVASEPQGASIFLNSEYTGEITPSVLKDLPTGEYTLELRKDGYDIQLDRIVVNNKEITEYSPNLSTAGTTEWNKRRKKAQLLSMVLPGGGHFICEQHSRGSIYAGTFVGAVVLTYFSLKDYADYEKQYDDAMKAYNASYRQYELSLHRAEAIEAIDNMDDTQALTNIYISTAAAIYVVQLVDMMFFGGGNRPVAKRNTMGSKLMPQPYASGQSGKSVLGLRWSIYFGEQNSYEHLRRDW
jgi:hypothetical protein